MESFNRVLIIILVMIIPAVAIGQRRTVFTHQDTLRGSITPERVWWDLSYYHLNVRVNPADSTLKGDNLIRYKVLKSGQKMQIDMQTPMEITQITQDQKSLSFNHDGNAWFVDLVKPQKVGEYNEVMVEFEGKPQISRNPPWSGDLSWRYDQNSNPFVVTTCQGAGASIWWPCKDHQYDEPDSMLISVTVPEPLTNVSNGRLRELIHNPDHTTTSHWFVSNPINSYCVNVNIGDYVHLSELYHGEKGDLTCDYYVLRDDLEKAKIQFKEVSRMLEAFEYWFGPYPFYEDGYKLVQVPYPGMEHQSCVTYGNGFRNGYGGRDVSGTGWGMKFDFIIVHESGHEWFGNSITSRDIADMWIHEGFIAYSESLFVNYFYGKQAGSEYVIGTRKNIGNRTPIIGVYNVNREGSGDMYSKAANMLHTYRQILNDDEKWRNTLRGLNRDFYHQTVTTQQIEDYLAKAAGMDLSKFFDQYLRDVRIPVFEYRVEGSSLKYRWTNCIDQFDMPIRLIVDGEEVTLSATPEWQSIALGGNEYKIAGIPDYYVTYQQVL